MKMMMKKHVWVSGVVALAMAGCQTAQKKDSVASNANPSASSEEDQVYDKEAIESFTRRENVSTWMSYYEDEIRDGSLKLSEYRNADRSIASVVVPIIEMMKGLPKEVKTKAFMNDLVNEVNLAGKEWQKSHPGYKWKNVSQEDDILKGKFSDELDRFIMKRLEENVLHNEKYATQKAAYEKFVVEHASDLKKSKGALLSTNPNAVADEALKRKTFRETTKAPDGTFKNAFVERKIDEFVNRKIKKLSDSGLPKEELDQMVTDLGDIRRLAQEYHARTGLLPPLDGHTCDVFAGVSETKNYKEFMETKVEDVKKWQAENKGKEICIPAAYRGTAKFQESRGRKGRNRDIAGVEMGACHLVHTDEAAFAQQILDGKVKVSEIGKCK